MELDLSYLGWSMALGLTLAIIFFIIDLKHRNKK